MSWYYAENNERRGPVDDAAFDGLVRAGSIKPDTLVWREGMPNWVAFAQAGYASPVAGMPPLSSVSSEARQPGEEMGVCSESGKILPRSELVEIEGRLVSAEYKNVVLQRIREGVSTSGGAEDPEMIAQRISETGWSIEAGDCLSRGWALVKSRFWLIAGSTFLVYLVIMAAGMIPFGGLIVQGPLFGGLFWLILKIIRGQPAAVEDAFQGFQRGFGHLIGVTLATSLLAGLCIVPGIVMIAVGAGIAQGSSSDIPVLAIFGGLLAFVGFLAMIYFTIAWMFALPLVVDKRVDFWPAMKLSQRVVGMHWWQIFWLLMLTTLVVGGIMLLSVGVVALILTLLYSATQNTGATVGLGIILGLGVLAAFFALFPLGFAVISVAYEDIFGQKPRV